MIRLRKLSEGVHGTHESGTGLWRTEQAAARLAARGAGVLPHVSVPVSASSLRGGVRARRGGAARVDQDQIGAKLVSKAAISTARRQMGSAVFAAPYREQVRPLGMNGQSAMPSVFWRRHRVMALDGSTLDLADEAGNAERLSRGRGRAL